jgi:NitT/TauT family transport system permease protein
VVACIAPFIAWLRAVVWFGSPSRGVFVAIVGAFPSVTLATISSFGHVPPLLKRAGRTLGAEGWQLYRGVIFPAALPGYVGGLQQAWGFAWKALMAGEPPAASRHRTRMGSHARNDARRWSPSRHRVIVLVEYLVFVRLERRMGPGACSRRLISAPIARSGTGSGRACGTR